MFVIHGCFAPILEVSRMLRIHRQRHVEEDPGAEVRAFVGLNIVHDRIHVHDDDILLFPNDGRERDEAAISGFNRGLVKLDVKLFPFSMPSM